MYMCTFNIRFRPLCVAIAIQGMAAKIETFLPLTI